MDINFLLDKNMYNSLFAEHSSFNLGTAISVVSIFITLIGFTFQKKFETRFKLRFRYFIGVGILSFISIFLLFLTESNFLNIKTLYIELISALLMLVAIIWASISIFYPIKKINVNNVNILYKELSTFLIQKYKNDALEHIDDIRYFYKSLLVLSLENETAKRIFSLVFTSNYFLKLFSENGYLFEETIRFSLKNEARNKDYIFRFIHKLFVYSLNNQNSFINSFINEEVYPGALSYVDDLFLNHSDVNFGRVLFEDVMFGLNHEGRISYIKLFKRYFELVYRANNHSTYNKDGYERKISYDDNLIKDFIKNIERFFEFARGGDQEIKELFDCLRNVGWYYQWGNKFTDKSDDLKKVMGEFIYEVLEKNSGRKLEEYDSTLRLQIIDLFDHFIEQRENNNNNSAFEEFTKRIVKKITGNDFGSNSMGYFPPVLKMYFLLFGFQVFSGKIDDFELKELHLPIMIRLKESFPKLYMGFKQEFYDKISLPLGKEEKLQKEGRDTINQYLPDNMNYDFENNTLEYYYSGENHGSRIKLNQFTEKSTTIITEEI